MQPYLPGEHGVKQGLEAASLYLYLFVDPVSDRHRILTSIEAERLNGFEENWTEGMPLRWRYFCMGNALVVGLVEMMGRRLAEIISGTKPSCYHVFKPESVTRKRLDDYYGNPVH